MKKTILTSILFSALCVSQIASADTLAKWTFESSGLGSSTPSFGPGANTATTNFYAELGLQAGTAAAIGLHNAAATYTSPAGNGSTKSLGAASWAVGDYFQFTLSSVGYSGVSVAFDQTGSNTGPKDYYLAYSTDGTSFTQFGSAYSLINGGWSAGTPVVTTSYSFDLSSITALDNAVSVYFRLVDATTTSINGGTVAAAGTDRVDNFTVTATPVSVPEPTAAALVGGFGLLGLFMAARRRD